MTFDYTWTKEELENVERYLKLNPKSHIYNTMEDYLYALKAELDNKREQSLNKYVSNVEKLEIAKHLSNMDAYKYDPKYDYPPYKVENSKENKIDYHFREDQYIKEFKEYIDSTYSKDYHYVGKGGTQATDLIIDSGHGKGFCVGNIIKYASRVGKKAGQDRKDILKILHYALILLHVNDEDNGQGE